MSSSFYWMSSKYSSAHSRSLWPAVVVTMQLLAWHPHFFDDELVLDARADDVRFVNFDELLDFMMADVIDNQRVLFHLGHHAFVIAEAESARLQRRHLLGRSGGLEAHGIGFDVEFLDVAAVGVHLDRGQHAAALVIVAVGKLVSGANRFDPKVSKARK